MKKRSEATQTLRAGCSKAEPQTTNTNKHTDRGDYNTLRSLARSVKRCADITVIENIFYSETITEMTTKFQLPQIARRQAAFESYFFDQDRGDGRPCKNSPSPTLITMQ